MRISDEGRQQVRPRDFYLAVFAVVLLLTGSGLWFMETGSVPAIPGERAVILVVMWSIASFKCWRGGVTAIQGNQWVLIVGWTLFGIRRLIPAATWLPTWLESLGVLLIVAAMLMRFIHFGRSQQDVGAH